MPMWLGTSERNFYGSGPWPDRPLEVIWEFETKLTSGRLHKEAGADQVGRDNLRFQGNAFISVRRTVTFIASILETEA